MAGNGGRPQSEVWLEDHGVFEYELVDDYHFDRIDVENTLHRQVRYETLDDDHGASIAIAMEVTPDRVPPIVTLRKKRGDIVLDGLHRWHYGTHVLGLRTWPAYVVTQDISDMTFDMLIGSANSAHPKPLTVDERMAWVATMAEKYGLPLAQLAREVQIPEARAQKHYQRVKAAQRFVALGLRGAAERLASDTKRRIASIASDEVMKSTAELVADAKMPSVDVQRLVASVNSAAAGGERAQLEVVDQWREKLRPEVEMTGKGKFTTPAVVRHLKSTVSRVERFDRAALAAVELDRIEPIRKSLKERTRQAGMALIEISETL